MSDYSTMSIEDLEELKERLLSQRSNLDHTIEEILNSLAAKRILTNEMSLKLNPYYKNNNCYIKVTINNNSSFKYTITKLTPGGKVVGITQFDSKDTDFLKYYKMCAKSEWDSTIDRLNTWFKDSNIKIEEL